MDTIAEYEHILQDILSTHARIPFANEQIQSRTVFQHEAHCYLLLAMGWQQKKRIHDCLVHADIIEGKIWLQTDETEYGIANELVDAGIPKDRIVLGFHSPEIRALSGFAAQ